MLQLLDTHQHLIYREKARYSWTTGFPTLDKVNFSCEKYANETRGLGIGGTLFMEVDAEDADYQPETQFIHSLLQNPANGLVGIIASCRPETNEGFDAWHEKCSEMGVVGFRRVLHVVDDEISKSRTFRQNLRKTGNAGQVFDICFLARQLPIAIELAKACDNTSLVLNHCGIPDIASKAIEPWRRNITALAALPNVHCKLSGIMTCCAPGTASAETIAPYVDHVLESFAPDRIVWGSDWPVVNLAKGLPEWIAVTREILARLSEDEARKIASANAERIYNVSLGL